MRSVHEKSEDCELFGVTYLSDVERSNSQVNHHEPWTYNQLKTFIDAVKAYTGKSQVDIVAHSLGSSMASVLAISDRWPTPGSSSATC